MRAIVAISKQVVQREFSANDHEQERVKPQACEGVLSAAPCVSDVGRRRHLRVGVFCPGDDPDAPLEIDAKRL